MATGIPLNGAATLPNITKSQGQAKSMAGIGCSYGLQAFTSWPEALQSPKLLTLMGR